MKRIAFIAACAIAAVLFVTFVGFPYRYSHESYRAVGEPPVVGQLQLQIRLLPDDVGYLLGAPIQTAGPYRLSIAAHGNECCDRRLALHSVVMEDDDGTHFVLLEGEYISEFSARAIWRTNIDGTPSLALPFRDGTELRIRLEMSLFTTSGEVRRTVEQKFLAVQSDGFGLFRLAALLWA